MFFQNLIKRIRGKQTTQAAGSGDAPPLPTRNMRVRKQMNALLGQAKQMTPGGTDLEPRVRERSLFVFPAPQAVPSAAVVNGVLTLNTQPPYLISDRFRAASHFHLCAQTPYQEIARTMAVTTPNVTQSLQIDYTDFQSDLFDGRVDIALVPYVLVKISNGSFDSPVDISLELQSDFFYTEQGQGTVVADATVGGSIGSSVGLGPPPNSSVLTQRVRVQQIEAGVTVWVLFMPGRQVIASDTIGRAYLSPLIVRRSWEAQLITNGIVGDGQPSNNITFDHNTFVLLSATVNSALNNPLGVSMTFGTDAVAGLTTVARDILAGAVQAQVSSGAAYDPNNATLSLPLAA